MGCSFKAISDERRRKILKEAGLVKERKVKQNRIYSLNKPKLQKVIETLKEISGK